MDNWRLAQSLEKLREQINAAYPKRSKVSDGGIGDPAHQAEGSASDHNPWVKDAQGVGVVTAFDFTHDPANGLVIADLADKLISSRDPRIKYIICNARIVIPSSSTGWNWRPYAGINPHSSHIHISVSSQTYDNVNEWKIEGGKKMVTNQQLNVLWRFYLGKAPTSSQRKAYIDKKTFEEVEKIAIESKTYKSIISSAQAGKLVAINHLPASVRSNYKPPVTAKQAAQVTTLDPGLYEVK
jgi:hypothetical protein